MKYREKGALVHYWWECRLVRPLWKTVWDFLRKLKIELLFDLAIPLLGLYPENPGTLLVGMQTGVATVEDSMGFPQKTKNGTAL